MSQQMARFLLMVPMLAGIFWTAVAVNVPSIGRDWATSRLLAQLMHAEPILIGLWCLVAAACTHVLTRGESELVDLLFIALNWAAIGHICWRLH